MIIQILSFLCIVNKCNIFYWIQTTYLHPKYSLFFYLKTSVPFNLLTLSGHYMSSIPQKVGRRRSQNLWITVSAPVLSLIRKKCAPLVLSSVPWLHWFRLRICTLCRVSGSIALTEVPSIIYQMCFRGKSISGSFTKFPKWFYPGFIEQNALCATDNFTWYLFLPRTPVTSYMSAE